MSIGIKTQKSNYPLYSNGSQNTLPTKHMSPFNLNIKKLTNNTYPLIQQIFLKHPLGTKLKW